MSSRSIGVTNVWLRRWMMSCVIRSPSCSQIRISRASSLRSGKSRNISSSRPAARKMFPPASSNRSKNSRSFGASRLVRRTGWGTVASRHVEPCLLQPAGERLTHLLPHGANRAVPVVLSVTQLDPPVVMEERVGGAAVAVERQPDAAGVDQRDAGRARTLELEVRVAEHDALGLHTEQQLGVAILGVASEGLHVGAGRRVAVERAVAGGRGRQPRELAAELRPKPLSAELERTRHRVGRIGVVHEPAVDVAANPLGVELAQPRDRLGRPGAPRRVVAPQDEALRRAFRERGLEREQVAVDVVKQAEHVAETNPTPGPAPSPPGPAPPAYARAYDPS